MSHIKKSVDVDLKGGEMTHTAGERHNMHVRSCLETQIAYVCPRTDLSIVLGGLRECCIGVR